jgi:hypothetical protein
MPDSMNRDDEVNEKEPAGRATGEDATDIEDDEFVDVEDADEEADEDADAEKPGE